MKRKILTAGALVALIAGVLLTGRVLGAFDAARSEQSAVVQGAGQGKYTLKEFEGKIAVFLGDELDTPAVQTGIPVSQLRSYDRLLLEDGITVLTYEELLGLLEDFSS